MGAAGSRAGRAALEAARLAGVARLLRLVHLQEVARNPLLRPRRYRRQHADDAGPRLAQRARLVRPSAISPQPAVRREHPLVAAGRSSDRGPDPGASAISRRGRGGTLGGRDRPSPSVLAAAVLAQPHRAAADPSRRVSVRAARLVLRRVDQRHVPARADRSSRLAAGAAGAQHFGDRRPEEAARRPDARNFDARCRWRSGSRC